MKNKFLKSFEDLNIKIESATLDFYHILALIFITLKLLGKIDWSWFLVLLPVTFGIYLLVFAIVFAVFMFLVLIPFIKNIIFCCFLLFFD